MFVQRPGSSVRPSGGRAWWAHFEFTRINIAPTILPKKIEDLRVVRQYSSSLFPLPFRLLQPLGHLLVVVAMARPTGCVTVPTVVLDGPDSSNHCFTLERPPMAAACGRSSGSGQMS